MSRVMQVGNMEKKEKAQEKMKMMKKKMRLQGLKFWFHF